jgi:hypothetical protein
MIAQYPAVRRLRHHAPHRASPYSTNDSSQYRFDVSISDGSQRSAHRSDKPRIARTNLTWFNRALPSDDILGPNIHSTRGNIRRDDKFHEADDIISIRKGRRGPALFKSPSTQAPIANARVPVLRSYGGNVSTEDNITHSKHQSTSIPLDGKNSGSRDEVPPRMESDPIWWNLVYARQPESVLGWDGIAQPLFDKTRSGS